MSEALGAGAAKAVEGSSADPHSATSMVRHLVHELRQPLSTIESIACYLQMVLPAEDEGARRQAARLLEAVQQANCILSDAVHYVQAAPPRPEIVDVGHLISDAVREATAGREKPWVCATEPARAAPVRLDPEQGRHMVRSVLQLLRLLSGPQAQVSVYSTTGADRVDVEFHSAGADVPADDLAAMSEPFSAYLPPGTGLSLASVRRITEAHGGGMEFRRAPGGGTLVRLSFPTAGE